MKTLKLITFILKYAFWGLTFGLLVLFFLPNSKLSFNWTSAQKFWHYYQSQLSSNNDHYQTTIPLSFADAVEKTSPSVVSINVFRPQGVRDSRVLASNEKILDVGVGFGSGIVLNKQGYIVTNFHVIKDADTITINFTDGTKRIAEVIGFDRQTDIAVLKTSLLGLQAANLAQFSNVRIGDVVMAIGTPFGQNQSVSLGIVSAITSHQFTQRIQTDAAINKGNSGGALINSIGEVVGINQMTLSSRGGGQTGINYAIPIDRVKRIAEDIILHGKVRRNWFGVHAIELKEVIHTRLFPNIAFGSGFFVSKIDANSPAFEAGIMVEDFITHFNNQPISGGESFYKLFHDTPIGEKVTVQLIRQNKNIMIPVQLRERP